MIDRLFSKNMTQEDENEKERTTGGKKNVRAILCAKCHKIIRDLRDLLISKEIFIVTKRSMKNKERLFITLLLLFQYKLFYFIIY